MEILDEKRNYLSGYKVLGAKIDRLCEMSRMFPKEKETYLKKADETRNFMKRIESNIERVDNGLLSEILFQKYVLGRSLETVSYALNYSKRQIERLHLVALEKISIC